MKTCLIDIHNQTLTRFEKDQKLIDIYQKKLDNLKQIIDNLRSPDLRLQQDYQKLIEKFNQVKSQDTYHFFVIDTSPIIEEYKKTLNKPKIISFMGVTEDSPVDDQIDELYEKYFQLLNKYDIELIHSKHHASPSVCPVCKCSGEIITTSDAITCRSCGLEKHKNQITFSYKDVNRINITSKYNYERKIHFKDCINQFQGKQNNIIKEDVYNKLYEKIELHNLSRSGNLPKNIKYEKVTKQHIYMFLKEIGYSKHYEDINLIYHNITGNKLHDISHLEKDLMRDFEKLNKLYKTEYINKKKINRKNFINNQYVLFQLLKKHRYPCTIRDFNFLKTIERKSFHDEICSDMFKKLGWNFTHIF